MVKAINNSLLTNLLDGLLYPYPDDNLQRGLLIALQNKVGLMEPDPNWPISSSQDKLKILVDKVKSYRLSFYNFDDGNLSFFKNILDDWTSYRMNYYNDTFLYGISHYYPSGNYYWYWSELRRKIGEAFEGMRMALGAI